MVGPEVADASGRDLIEVVRGHLRFTRVTQERRDPLTRIQGRAMLRAEHPRPIVHERDERHAGFLGPPCLEEPVGDFAARGQRVGVIGSEHPQQISKQRLVRPQSLIDPLRPPVPMGDVVARRQRVGMVRAEYPDAVGEQRLELA